jgi:hypothetical protein
MSSPWCRFVETDDGELGVYLVLVDPMAVW